MNIEKRKINAILTGDIVGSTRLHDNERRTLHKVLTSSSDSIVEFFSNWVPYKPEIFRGDSWQFLVTEPSKSLRIGLFYRATIQAGMEARRVDTRISIGLGTINFLPGDMVSSGDGEAYRLSGEALEQLHKSNRLVISFPYHLRSDLTKALDVIIKLIDLQAKDWTEKQAKAVAGALLELTQESIAKNWFDKDITQQAIAQHLDRAGWTSIELGIKFFEEIVSNMIRSII
jgi:hypothetical protein